uniref:Uncharacterized protein n=1 Tax=Anguilla anguilla TaxID=7936 RepID=A0A0E9R983_ANGAN
METNSQPLSENSTLEMQKNKQTKKNNDNID